MKVAVLIYAVTALMQLVCAVVLLVRHRESELARRVAFACAATGVWSIAILMDLRLGEFSGWPAIAADGLRYAGWCAVLLSSAISGVHPWLSRGTIGVCGLITLVALALWIAQSAGFIPPAPAGLQSMSGLGLAFLGLLTTEQVIRGAPVESARIARVLALCIGSQFAFDLFLFAQAELLGAIDVTAWLLRGPVVALLIIPVLFNLRKLPQVQPRIFISRHVVFYTSAFVTVGLYLSIMALGGYYVRQHGGSWGNALEILFFCGAAAVLISLLLSDMPLRHLRVFIAKHFYRNKYDYRVAWLQFVQTLSQAEEKDTGRNAIHAVAQIIGSPGGLLVLRDDAAGSFIAHAIWPEEAAALPARARLPIDSDLPRFLHDRQWVIDLREHARHPDRYRGLVLPDWLTADGPWRIISPLLLGNRLIGFLVLRAPPDPFTMTFEDRDLLKTVGRHVAVQLAQRQADEKLAEGRQFAAYSRFTAFVMHDLKNSVAQLQLLVANAGRHRNDPAFVDDAISTISNAVERMKRLIEQLQDRDAHGQERDVDLASIARAAVQRGKTRRPEVVVRGDLPSCVVRADPERLTVTLEHVLRNAQDATPTTGSVELEMIKDEKGVQLVVSDNGSGMDDEFVRQRLFRPFDSTKGSKGMGIGAYQVREYVRSLGGDVDVQSVPGRGTRFCIRLDACLKTNPAY